ncbi:response regulator [Algoriphagus litoralis]|uniref:response regulator n=1 Tax=Algoriphagus litoralis TaxID=2202829 RepID=UPI000DB94F56|nr:response regulator [Algoriphagus litoralis]
MSDKILLLVDDDKISLLITKKVIQTFSPETAFAEIIIKDQPKEALELVKESLAKDLDLIILLDINMPLISGWDFLDRLSQLDPKERYPVILLTSSVSELDRERAFDYNRVLDFFSKPMDQSLINRLFSLLQDR